MGESFVSETCAELSSCGSPKSDFVACFPVFFSATGRNALYLRKLRNTIKNQEGLFVLHSNFHSYYRESGLSPPGSVRSRCRLGSWLAPDRSPHELIALCL